ncbi:hypothetical protein A0J61_01686 [Choanephora cucurbitarum]|uniref:Protein kinase domain-containing protein n=1 Tax=Choanephora cucurbitarum TaxID=101091 RepID=A0A1C7NMD0_9FUNG|nr:hypothetical protein A0J61_01686 [Choanephora cucurbitarum]
MTRWFIPASLRLRRKEPRDPLIAEKYRCLGILGQGAFGIVHLAVDIKTHQRFAMKEISKSRLERQQRYQPRPASNEQKKRRLNPTIDQFRLKEADILRNLPAHTNIIQLIEVIQDPDYSQDSIFLVMELAEKGVVMTLSEPTLYSVQQCRSIFRQLVYAVDHLHQQGIVHGDIKPHNLLLSKDNTVKLVDFGHAIHLCDIDRSFYSMSSPAFTAPEVIKKQAIKLYAATCADVWAMGVTLYCLVYGQLPFQTTNLLDLFEEIQTKDIHYPHTLDSQLLDVFSKLLEKDPTQRVTLKEIKLHPWLQTE